MKNKLLAGALTLVLLGNAYVLSDFHEKITDKNKQVEQLQGDVKTKSTEIANLETVIVQKDKKLEAEQLVIEKQKDQLQKQSEQIKSEQAEQDKKQSEIVKKQDEIDKLKKENERLNANFNLKKEGSDVGGRKINVEATAYIAMCSEGCTGKTATGEDVSDSIYYQGHRVIAVDTSLIPLNSLVRVETNGQSFTAMAIDTGGGINGHEIDVLVGSTSEAKQFGVRQATVTVLREGK